MKNTLVNILLLILNSLIGMMMDSNLRNLEPGILIHKIIIHQNYRNTKHPTFRHEQQKIQELDVKQMDLKL
jgi:hypothetical protein